MMRIPRVAVALAALALTACQTLPNKQIGKTATALTGVQTTFHDYYAALNAYGREVYIRSHVYRGLPLSSSDAALEGSIYPTAAIEARLNALKLIGRYAELLNAYAGGSPAKDLAAAATGFSDSAFKLQGDLQGTGDSSLAAYAGPVGKLVGLISQWGTDAYLKKAFKTQIGLATPEVLKVLDLLQADATNVLQPSHLIGSSSEFAALVGYYNSHASSLSLSERDQIAGMLIEAADARDAGRNLGLADVIVSAKKAVTALNKQVTGPSDPADIAAATAALDEFSDRVKALSAALDDLKQAKKG